MTLSQVEMNVAIRQANADVGFEVLSNKNVKGMSNLLKALHEAEKVAIYQ